MVFHFHEQKEASLLECETNEESPESKAVASATQSAYDEAVKDLTDFYVLAEHDGVPKTKLDMVLRMGLGKTLADYFLKEGR